MENRVNPYLLPPEEKVKYIIELRKQGKTYREIAKELKVSLRDVSAALRQYAPSKEEQELTSKIKELEKRIRILEEHQKKVSEIIEMFRTGVGRRFMKDLPEEHCENMDEDGYCTRWIWRHAIKDWDMKEDNGRYHLNVKKHPWVCIACPSFVSEYMRDMIFRELERRMLAERALAEKDQQMD